DRRQAAQGGEPRTRLSAGPVRWRSADHRGGDHPRTVLAGDEGDSVTARGGHHKGEGSMKRRRRGTAEDARPLDRSPGTRSRAVRVLYGACEGESTEPNYLDYLTEEFGDGDQDRPPFRIQPVWRRNGMLPTETVAAVRQYADTDEAWVLFDRDGRDRDT